MYEFSKSLSPKEKTVLKTNSINKFLGFKEFGNNRKFQFLYLWLNLQLFSNQIIRAKS